MAGNGMAGKGKAGRDMAGKGKAGKGWGPGRSSASDEWWLEEEVPRPWHLKAPPHAPENITATGVLKFERDVHAEYVEHQYLLFIHMIITDL